LIVWTLAGPSNGRTQTPLPTGPQAVASATSLPRILRPAGQPCPIREPLLAQLSTAYVAALFREWHLADWSLADVLTALKRTPDGEQHRFSDAVRNVPGWVRFRLLAWRSDPLNPVSPPGRSPAERLRADAILVRARTRARAEAAARVTREAVPAPAAEYQAQEEQVQHLLSLLPLRQRQVLAWTYDGYAPTEIAAHLSTPRPSAVPRGRPGQPQARPPQRCPAHRPAWSREGPAMSGPWFHLFGYAVGIPPDTGMDADADRRLISWQNDLLLSADNVLDVAAGLGEILLARHHRTTYSAAG
jgi:hypothetical protein